MMTFIYIIFFICLYIIIGITLFGICYRFNFLDVRDEYIRDKRNKSENENIFIIITFWPFISLIVLFICTPKRLLDLLIHEIDEDMHNEKIYDRKYNYNSTNKDDIHL